MTCILWASGDVSASRVLTFSERHSGTGEKALVKQSKELNTSLAAPLASRDLGEVTLSLSSISSVIEEEILCKMGVIKTTLKLQEQMQ